ncbi:MAG: hypothetical protein SGCHY_004771, partial [Lobulomycetales sp.]
MKIFIQFLAILLIGFTVSVSASPEELTTLEKRGLLKKLKSKVKDTAKKVVKKVKTAKSSAGNAAKKVVKTVKMAKSSAGNAAKKAVKTVKTAKSSASKALAKVKIPTSKVKAAIQLSKTIGKKASSTVKAIQTSVPKKVASIAKNAKLAISKVSAATIKAKNTAAAAGKKLSQSKVGKFVMATGKTLSKGISKASSKASSSMKTVVNAAKNSSAVKAIRKNAPKKMASMAKNAKLAISKVSAATTMAKNTAAATGKKLSQSKVGKFVTSTGTTLSKGIGKASFKASSAMKTIAKTAITVSDKTGLTKQFKNAAKKAGELNTAAKAKIKETKTKLENSKIGKAASSTVKSIKNSKLGKAAAKTANVIGKGATMAREFTSGVGTGIGNGVKAVGAAVINPINTARAIKDLSKKALKDGKSFVQDAKKNGLKAATKKAAKSA